MAASKVNTPYRVLSLNSYRESGRNQSWSEAGRVGGMWVLLVLCDLCLTQAWLAGTSSHSDIGSPGFSLTLKNARSVDLPRPGPPEL